MRLAVSGQMARERQRSGTVWKGVSGAWAWRNVVMLLAGRAANVADVAGIERVAVLARASGPLGGRHLGNASKREARTRGADANRTARREVAPEREGPARRFAC